MAFASTRLLYGESHYTTKISLIPDENSRRNAASTSGTTKEGDQVPSLPYVNSDVPTPVSNPFKVLNAGEEIDCDSSGQNHKVSKPVGSESSKADDDKIQEEESLWSRFQKSKKDSLSKSQDDSNDDSEGEEYPPHDFTRISSIGGGFSLEDDDLDCYDGYEPQVYNLSRKSQAFCHNYDIRLNSRGKK
ncbi:hypothetical protein Tco_1572215 [Tanacetum coccineum]